MTELEDDLRDLLARRGAVDSQLTGPQLRALAEQRRSPRAVATPIAAGLLAAAAIITPFVLIQHHDGPARPTQLVTPASTPSSTAPASRPVPSQPPPLVASVAPRQSQPATSTLSAMPTRSASVRPTPTSSATPSSTRPPSASSSP